MTKAMLWMLSGSALLGMVFAAPAEAALVNLSFYPPAQIVNVGDTVEINLVATSTDPNTPMDIGAVDAILEWEAGYLGTVGYTAAHAGYAWMFEGFFNNPDGLNANLGDGNAMYTALAQVTQAAYAPGPPGLIVTTLQFTALAETPGTLVSFLPEYGQFSRTRVMKFSPANLEVTGEIGGAALVTIIPEPTAAGLLLLSAGLLLIRRR